MPLIVMLNNFLHDLSAAWWMISALLLRHTLRSSPEPPDKVHVRLARYLCNSMSIALIGVIVFGAFRLWSYKTYEWVEAAGGGQVTLLAVKHIFFAAIVILGLLQWRKGRAFSRLFDSQTTGWSANRQ